MNITEDRHHLQKVSVFNVSLTILLILESDRLITSIIGLDKVLASWLYSALIFVSFFCALAKLALKNKFKESKYFYYPIIVFAVIFIVSAISATVIFPKPTTDWLPSLYTFAPLFIFYAFYLLDIQERELSITFISIAIIVSTLLIIDRIQPIDFLNDYFRPSSFIDEKRRIVILKNEVIFGIIALLSLIICGKMSLIKRQALIAIALLLFLTQVLVMESRLGLIAIFVASVMLLYLNGLSKKVFATICVSSVLGSILIPTIFDQYIEKLMSMSVDDKSSNIGIRIDSVEHAFKIYLESYGLGVGSMSPTGVINNILTSDPRYNIADTGAFSTLAQFGPFGLYIWIFLTVKCLKSFKQRFFESKKTSYFSAASYALLMGFTVSVLPLSFFTQSWNITMGGVLLYLLWIYKRKPLYGKSVSRKSKIIKAVPIHYAHNNQIPS